MNAPRLRGSALLLGFGLLAPASLAAPSPAFLPVTLPVPVVAGPVPDLPQDPQNVQGTSANADEKGTSDQVSASLLEKARLNFARNDFAQASFAAEHVTSPAMKKDAQAILGQVHQYVVALQDGVAAEARRDTAAAIQAYTIAVRIKSDGPGDPAARITRIQGQAALAGASAQHARDRAAGRSAHLAAEHARAAALVAKGLSQESTGDLHGAFTSFSEAQAADPLNNAAVTGVQRTEAKTPPLDAGPAIRAFYAGQYGEAENQLNALSSAPNAPCRGAVFFYLGAARLYRAVLEGGQSADVAAQRPDIQAAFHQAHALGYVPLPRFVSPALISVWKGIS